MATERDPGNQGSSYDAYERNDPKHPDYVNHIFLGAGFDSLIPDRDPTVELGYQSQRQWGKQNGLDDAVRMATEDRYSSRVDYELNEFMNYINSRVLSGDIPRSITWFEKKIEGGTIYARRKSPRSTLSRVDMTYIRTSLEDPDLKYHDPTNPT